MGHHFLSKTITSLIQYTPWNKARIFRDQTVYIQTQIWCFKGRKKVILGECHFLSKTIVSLLQNTPWNKARRFRDQTVYILTQIWCFKGKKKVIYRASLSFKDYLSYLWFKIRHETKQSNTQHIMSPHWLSHLLFLCWVPLCWISWYWLE